MKLLFIAFRTFLSILFLMSFLAGFSQAGNSFELSNIPVLAEDCDTLEFKNGQKELAYDIQIENKYLFYKICGQKGNYNFQVPLDEILYLKDSGNRKWTPSPEGDLKQSENENIGNPYLLLKSVQPLRSDVSPNIIYLSIFYYPENLISLSENPPYDYYRIGGEGGVALNFDRSISRIGSNIDLGISSTIGFLVDYETLLFSMGPQLFMGPNTSCMTLHARYSLL